MRIAIDLTPATYTLTGIGVYVQQLVEQVSRQKPDIEWKYPFFTEVPLNSFWRWRLSSNLPTKVIKRIELRPAFAFRHNRQRAKSGGAWLKSSNFDLYHVTNAQSQFDHFEPKYVITVHDLAWMRVPREELPKPNVDGLDKLTELIRGADHVICDSDCTRVDVLELVGRNPDEVTTIHLAQRPFFQLPADGSQRERARKSAIDGRPYFLAISTIEPRKNYVRLVKSFALMHQKYPEFRLLIAGAKRSAWNDVNQAIHSTGMANIIRVLGHVSNQKLLELLWGCEALVYPSLYEGFGLPALEAMACGTPVICSAAGSLGEVVGNAALIVDPLDVDSIADGMQSIAKSSDLQIQLRNKSLEHASQFSWDRTAKKTLAVYERVIG